MPGMPRAISVHADGQSLHGHHTNPREQGRSDPSWSPLASISVMPVSNTRGALSYLGINGALELLLDVPEEVVLRQEEGAHRDWELPHWSGKRSAG